MPRKRDLKPGFFKNEALAELPPLTRMFFAGLWCWADREGRLEDRPKKLKGEILPYDDFDADAALDELERAGLIVLWLAAIALLITALACPPTDRADLPARAIAVNESL